ncbi:hypothetical protein [Streptomyces sp. SM8]|uniref:hypothetical protein n=1 Tax=Streptomyces sp. SM8 TaxID=1195457 RepID=UPI0002830E6D|nr:hypothetical protein [Streptomyces sp. SM8]PKA32905.1 hypothetical protein SM8_032075 [Streptomyces sp. SM8]
MSHSPLGAERQEGQPDLVSIPAMPDRLVAAGVKRVGAPRIRQLVATDPDFPATVYEHGRIRLWNWPDVLTYFRARVTRQGERTDLSEKNRPTE